MGEAAVRGGAEEREKAGGGDGWGRFPPQVRVRVLLVESDDPTRRIIAALLGKCNYEVAAAADGLKAWETLKEKPQNIDLVLAEVELPLMSGYGLLTMMMEHETCKNIPFIMMSSHDSMNMVFKCILKGAADFLVKPIRKNELRNLWQHVWRRHTSDGLPRGIYRQGYENLTQPKVETKPENNAASSYSRKLSPEKNRECSEEECDTQSSLTRSGVEAVSAYVKNTQENMQPDCISSSVSNDLRNYKENACDKSVEELPMNESETEGSIGDPNVQHEERDQKFCQHKPYSEADLVGKMDNHSWCNQEHEGCFDARDNTSKEAGTFGDAKDQNWCPSLELSLRVRQPIDTDNQEKDEFNMLNHSNSSAFSRYYRTMPSPLLTSDASGRTEPNNYVEQSRDKDLQSNTSKCIGAPPQISLEDGDGLSNQLGRVTGSHLELLPFPAPMIAPAYNGLLPGYSPVIQPIFYTESVDPVLSSEPTNHEATHSSLSHQSDEESFNAGQHHDPHDQNTLRPYRQQHMGNMCDIESLKVKSHVSSVTGESRSGVLNDSRSRLNSNAWGDACDGSNGNQASDISRSTVESTDGNDIFTHDVTKLADCHRSVQREAALKKFRLKRKERCYEKKVRYQSRKRLADERPRVKGQFVRHVQYDPRPMEVDSHHSN